MSPDDQQGLQSFYAEQLKCQQEDVRFESYFDNLVLSQDNKDKDGYFDFYFSDCSEYEIKKLLSLYLQCSYGHDSALWNVIQDECMSTLIQYLESENINGIWNKEEIQNMYQMALVWCSKNLMEIMYARQEEVASRYLDAREAA